MTERVLLGDVVDIASGQVDPREKPYCDWPHVGGDNIESGSGILFGLRTARELSLISGKYEFGPQDVLYSKIRPALNKVALPDFIGICSADMYPLHPRKGILERRYLAYLLRQHDFLSYAQKHSSRTNIPKINRDALLAYEFQLPPLPEQRRIADILDKADAIRRKRKEAIDLTEELLRSAFLEMFGDPMTNPKGWEVTSLEQSFADDPRIGTLVPAGDGPGHMIVRVGEIGKYDVSLTKCKRASLTDKELDRFGLFTGDVVLARAIGSEDHLGKASVVQALSEPVAFDSHVMRLRLNPRLIDPYFFVQWLRSPGGRARFMREAGRTAVQFNVNGKQIGRVQIPLPPKSEQLRFRRAFDRVRATTERLHASHREAEMLFLSLTHRAFSGELTGR